MTKFWRLFTSDYVQDFLDSASIPTFDELVEPYKREFDRDLKTYKENIKNYF